MNTDTPNEYNPADDDNQGVVQLMAQGEEASPGEPQTETITSGPDAQQEPEPTDTQGVNDELLTVQNVDKGDAAEMSADS